MSENDKLDDVNVVVVSQPAADRFDGTLTTSAVNVANYAGLSFLVSKGAGATGTSTITVEKCTASDGTGATAIPFTYQRIQSGFTTTAGANDAYLIHLSQGVEGLASAGASNWIRLKAVEVVNDPVAGAVLALAYNGRYGDAAGPSLLV
jgi:hypothetical protein